MANKYRGETTLDVDGTAHTLRLSLAALAHLEDAFGVDHLQALIALLIAPDIKLQTVQSVLCQALICGENLAQSKAEDVLNRCDPIVLAKLYARLIHQTFLADYG